MTAPRFELTSQRQKVSRLPTGPPGLPVSVTISCSKGKDQPGKVANPARGQLNRENGYFPVPFRASKFDVARRVRQFRPASACSSLYSG